MKKFFTLIAVAFVSVVAFADSYTITFNNGGETQAVINPANAITTYVTAESADYISSFAKTDGTNVTRVYLKSDWEGAKVSNLSTSGVFSAGNLTINLSAKGAVKANSIIVNGKGTVIVAGKEIACGDDAYADVSAELDGSELSAITVTSSAVAYIKSITVNYTKTNVFDKSIAHAPMLNYPGCRYEVTPLADVIIKKDKNGSMSYGFDNVKYPWIEYIDLGSDGNGNKLTDGSYEVTRSGSYSSLDIVTGDTILAEDTYPAPAAWGGKYTGTQYPWSEYDLDLIEEGGSAVHNYGSPKVNADYKSMNFYVTAVDSLRLILSGGGGSANNQAKIVVKDVDGNVVCDTLSAVMLKKSNNAANAHTTALWIKGLDRTKYYQVAMSRGVGDAYLYAIHLFGADQHLAPAYHKPQPTAQYWEAVLGARMLTSKTKASASKKGIDDATFNWLTFTNTSSKLDDGTDEVPNASRYTVFDPVTATAGETRVGLSYNGQWNGPVVSCLDANGNVQKSLNIGVKKATKVRIFAAGSATSAATDNNAIVVKAVPNDGSEAIVVNSEAGKIWGKNNKVDASTGTSDSVSVVLDPSKKYQIEVTSATKDIEILGINVLNAESDSLQAAGAGTLNMAIANAVKAVDDTITVDLDAYSGTYTLNGAAPVGQKVVTINGNGAGIKTDATGQITTKNSLTIDNVVIDASEATVAPIAMAPKADLNANDSITLYTMVPDTIKAADGTDSLIVAGTTTYKYENAANKVFEAQLLSVKNSTIKTASSFISGGNALWALRKLEVDNCIVETSANSGKAFLDWEQGASQIKDIVISNSTLYADSTNTAQRFHRYSAQVDPWRVWGYPTGTDKNAAGQNTWTLTNNTIVNLCGSKEFSNNIKNTAATTFTFKGNVFANTWRLQKIGSNVTREFNAADNAICGGTNTVDGTDASKWATEEADSILGIYVANGKSNFVPAAISYAANMKYGDPRWLEGVTAINAVDSLKTLIAKAGDLVDAADAHTELAEYAALATEMAAAQGIVTAEPVVYAKAVAEIPVLAAAIDAYKAAVEVATGISSVTTESTVNEGRAYNLNGQRVNATAKGVVIMNGKKYINK